LTWTLSYAYLEDMPKRIKQDTDPTTDALRVVRQAVDDESFPKPPPDPSQEQIRAVMAAMGRRGGPKGGVARAAALSPRRRRAIAKKAAAARWQKAVK
jgi:hypothetical protein